MKRKEFRRMHIERNSRGYWERGGGSERELFIAVIMLAIVCVAVGTKIVLAFLG